MPEWNRFPDKGGIKSSGLEKKIDTEVNKLKKRFAELSIADPRISVKQALDIVIKEYTPASNKEAYETSVLYLTVERLRLNNVMNMRVRRYLPNHWYKDKGKNPFYFPKHLEKP